MKASAKWLNVNLAVKKKNQFKPVMGGLLVLGLKYGLHDQAGFQEQLS